MYKNKIVGVIIAAAGFGLRMGGGVAKQFLKIEGVPVLIRTIKAFADKEEVDFIYVIAGEHQMEYCVSLLEEWGLSHMVEAIVEGGEERQDSVYAGLCSLAEEIDLVLIHDGARPFVSGETIDAVLSQTERTGAAIAAVPVKDTVRRETEEGGQTLPRNELFLVQTPQGFKKSLIIAAYEAARRDEVPGTDDAGLVERLGHPVARVSGN